VRWGRPAPLPLRAERGRPLAEAVGVGVHLGGRRVLEGVDLQVRAGELLALVGPNGAGKTTLLSALAGDLRPGSGAVLVDGRPAGGWGADELARRRAVLPQHAAVSFPFRVVDVVRMGRSPWLGTPLEADDDSAVRSALAEADVLHLAARRVPELSGGERARVALARVLAQSTQLVMLDEPTAALDVRHQELVFAAARRRVDDGDGVVAVVHDLGLAAAHADRVALIAEGRLVALGRPHEVMVPELLGEVYGHGIEVLVHPVTGDLLVVPLRTARLGAHVNRSAEPVRPT
jgi:iron complex transport system ATP-binding protein